MSDFPASHTTTTAAPADNNEGKIYLNSGYIRTTEGKLKCAELIICILAFVMVMASYHPRISEGNWISFVSMGGFWTTGVLLFLYVINVIGFLAMIPWLALELGFTTLWTFFCFVSGCVGASFASKYANGEFYAVAAFFSFVAMCLYGFDAFLNYKKWRASGSSLCFGFKSTTTTTTTTVTTRSTLNPPDKY